MHLVIFKVHKILVFDKFYMPTFKCAEIRSKYEHKTGRKGPPARGKRLGKRAMNAELKRRRAAQFAAMGRFS